MTQRSKISQCIAVRESSLAGTEDSVFLMSPEELIQYLSQLQGERDKTFLAPLTIDFDNEVLCWFSVKWSAGALR